jgi:hypothetical protein
VAMSRFGSSGDNRVRLSDDCAMRPLRVFAGISAALSFAAPSHADPGADLDASFLDSLTRAGIKILNPSLAVKNGKSACGLMEQGKPELDVIQLVIRQNPGLDTTRAAQFTAISASAYCPQYLQRAAAPAAPPNPAVPPIPSNQ